MGTDDVSGAVERLLAPLLEAAVERVRVSSVDGLRLGLGVGAQTVDAYLQRVCTLTAPEHAEAVAGILGSLAAALRDLSAGFSMQE